MQRLLSLVDRFSSCRVLVAGDLVADEFLSGQPARVSREAPVLILRYEATRILPGGGGNAANNVASLGGAARLFGLAGRDEPGRELLGAFAGRVNTRGVLRPAAYRTPTKTRILAGGIHSAKQQIVRIDREPQAPPPPELAATLADGLMAALPEADAVLLSDYGYGLVTPGLAERVSAEVSKAGAQVPVLIDSRYNLGAYRNLTACTPNQPEVEQLLGMTIGDEGEALEKAGRTLLRRLRMQAVLVTRGSRGMALFEPSRPTLHVPIYGGDEVADVTGAGDTVMAVMSLALAAGSTFAEAARLANYAGGIVVMKRGTATVSPEELRAAIRDGDGAGTQP